MKIKARILKDSKGKTYTCYLDDKPGGPIISAETAESLKEKFIEAWKVCYAVACILRYSTHQDFNVFGSTSPIPPEIEFIEEIFVM